VPTIFTRIIDGEIPGRFVWRDERCVVFLSIDPLAPGHALVVPIAEVDHWLDLEPELVAHLSIVAQAVGQAQQEAFSPARVGLVVAGFDVPHVHLHVAPIRDMGELDFANVAHDVPAEQMEASAEVMRTALRAAGHPETTDS